jgi:hypothetical protein
VFEEKEESEEEEAPFPRRPFEERIIIKKMTATMITARITHQMPPLLEAMFFV